MDSEVQRGMESIKSENQAGSALFRHFFSWQEIMWPLFWQAFFLFLSGMS